MKEKPSSRQNYSQPIDGEGCHVLAATPDRRPVSKSTMDSLGRRRGREMARLRRQRSQEWRERDYSSSDNEEDGSQQYRYMDERMRLQYEQEVKAGLEARGFTTVPQNRMHVPAEGLYMSDQTPKRNRPPHAPTPSSLQTVENRAYTPLSGSDGDLEADAASHVPVQLLLRGQSLGRPEGAPGTGGRGRLALALHRGPSTSSSDNNSDTPYPECDLVRRGSALNQNDFPESPPEPAPPEVPPRGISMHHVEMSALRTPRGGYLESECESEPSFRTTPSANTCIFLSQELLNLANSARTVYPTSNDESATSLTSTKEFLADRGNTPANDRADRHHHHAPSQPQPPQQTPAQIPQLPQQQNHQQQQQQSHSTQTQHHNHHQNHHPRPAPHPLHPSLQVTPSPPPIQHQHQAGAGSQTTTTSTTTPPVAMPVIPVRNNLQQQGGPQFSSANFHIRKSCSHRCSWKCVAIFLIFLTVILTGVLAYFGAVNSMTTHLESNHACILVEEAKLASMGLDSTVSPTVKVAVPTQYPQRVLPGDYENWPVVEVHLSKRVTHSIPPHGFWNVQLHQTQVSYVRFNLTVPPTANFAIFGRRHMPPTITQHDFQETIHKQRINGKKMRSTLHAMVEITFLQHMEPGWWFLSVYNDDSQQHTLSMISELALDVTARCPNNCHGHGTCQLGQCNCYSGYAGKACEESVCPVLCSNHGTYSGGVCRCERGWKGVECNVQEQDCEVPDCNGHGQCLEGVCFCSVGYKSKFCEEVDCADPRCSEHGVCAEGQCICRPGWRGQNCSLLDDRLVRCLPNCSGHGAFDLETGKCLCDKYWTGNDCSEALCGANCGPFGQCIGGQCQCADGWTGPKCDQRLCDPRCVVHGQCNNGTCVCMQGWNGKHCSLEGCPRDCNHHGECRMQEDDYQCSCHSGWDGEDCSIRLENVCDDGIDNDNDGLKDCADSECCLSLVCQDSLMCVMTADPVDVLLRKQPPAVTASFYQRMKFLIEEESVQSYVHKDEYSESRVSVIRGRVVDKHGRGLIGIRVSVDLEPKFGFTLSRDQGWFDIMVNGGGAITLQFQRSPFKPIRKTVLVPWNQIVVMDTDVVMVTSSDELPAEAPIVSTPCMEHSYQYLRPVVYETWKPSMVGGCTATSAVYAETQVLQESVAIPGSNLHLLYQSSSAAGYHGALYILLTPTEVPTSLRVVHLRIVLEGILFEKQFEADPNVTFTFSWNKRNVYKQKVYGVTTAKVSVGYEYYQCQQIAWTTRTATLQGYEMEISDVGGWNLDIHHRYNFNDGILQKGDGTTIHFSRQPRIVHVTMGTGEQRPLMCPDCHGLAKDAKLLAPVALTSGADGSIYVGDFNLIRRISPNGHVYTILQLRATQVSYHYHLVMHPADSSLYVSDPERGQILRVKNLEKVEDPATNFEVAVGNGERCLPGDREACGDGGLAREARLAYPKGMAISSEGHLYFADGTNIRIMTRQGVIHTLIGDHQRRSFRRPLPCAGGSRADETHLQWPTDLALSPLDGALYFVDDNLVLKLTKDQRVLIAAGRPLHCEEAPPSSSPPPPSLSSSASSSSLPADDTRFATDTTLGSLLGIAFMPHGDLLIAESNARKVNFVYRVTPNGELLHFAGTEPQCDCGGGNCTCPTPRNSLAVNTQLFAISGMTVTPDGIVHISDQGSLQILSVFTYVPDANQHGDYEVVFPDAQEIYVFNRYGQHTTTRNILTGKTVYLFSYNVNTSFGKLSSVTDASGNKISFLRDYSNRVNTIENAQGQKCRVKMSKIALIEAFILATDFELTFEYQGSTGLLRSRSDSAGNVYIYQYDEDGRLTEAILPTGQVMRLTVGLSVEGAVVTVTEDERDMYSLTMTGYMSVIIRQDSSTLEAKTYANGSVSVTTGPDFVVQLQTAPHPVLQATNSIQQEMFYVPTRWRSKFGPQHSDAEWRYNIIGDSRMAEKVVERQMWVNNTRALTVEYDQVRLREILYDRDRNSILAVQYDATGKPIKWSPTVGGISLNLSYDRFGRLATWRWGPMGEELAYDRHGLLSEVRYIDGSNLQYSYGASGQPTKITLPSGRQFNIHYDTVGNLKYISTPAGTRHVFSLHMSLGYYRLLYTPPGTTAPLVKHFANDGRLLLTTYPDDQGRVLYRYDNQSRLAVTVFGHTQIHYQYADVFGLVSTVHQTDGEFELTVDYKYQGLLLKEEKQTYGTRTGLSGARFYYRYDAHLRLQSVEGRIGGQDLPALNYSYNARTGLPEQIGQFKVLRARPNETSVYDGTAVFNRVQDAFFRDLQTALFINGIDVYKLEVEYDNRSRVSQVRTHTKKLGLNDNVNVKNYTYDVDGQLKEVQTHDSWSFNYDRNGNMVSLKYRANSIPLRYNEMDRILKFAETLFQVDKRGFITQRGEERFQYNARGLIVRASRKERYDVWYYYDSQDRLIARKDHFGNVTQFFYVNPSEKFQVTHIHSPRDGRIMTLLYDDQGHLIYVKIGHNIKYYIGTDNMGTPIVIYNHYGEIVREMHRSPYGHIDYDSNPFIYLPIDYQGGVLDSVTGLVHMRTRLYYPLIGMWMTPAWDELLKHVNSPQALHLYRINGNDPVNPPFKRWFLKDHESWLSHLGYNLGGVAPQHARPFTEACPPPCLVEFPHRQGLPVISGVLCNACQKEAALRQLSTAPPTLLKREPVLEEFKSQVAHAHPPIGASLVVSRVQDRAWVNAAEGANSILRDVMTSVLNQSLLLDLRLASHHHETFYFVKEHSWQRTADLAQLQRLGNNVNITLHEAVPADAATATSSDPESRQRDIRIHTAGAAISVRYGTSYEHERSRLLRHAKQRAINKAWAREHELLQLKHGGTREWSAAEVEQILDAHVKSVAGYHADYIHDVAQYPELADDPSNIVFRRGGGASGGSSHKRRR